MYSLRIFITIVLVLFFMSIFPIYKVVGNKLNSFKKTGGRLIVCSHNYEHMDIFIMLRELSYLNEQVHVIFADKIWNKIIEIFKVVNTKFIFTTSNTTNKMIDKIMTGHTVLIFLYNLDAPRTGIYHVLKSTGCDLISAQIKADHEKTTHLNSSTKDIIVKNFNKTYTLDYNKIDYNLGPCPKKFMNEMKKYL